MGELGMRDLHVGKNVRMCYNEPLSNIMDLMIASDVVVAIDSGPLHLARALRVKPIALYTGKINDPETFTTFPWYAEDGTIEPLKPWPPDTHVAAEEVLMAIERRLSHADGVVTSPNLA